MKVVDAAAIADIKILKPTVYEDSRGFFFESYNANIFNDAIGRKVVFVQDNHSFSHKGTLRGLHYQTNHIQGKLVRVISGAVFDVAVDLRRKSPTFGKSVTICLAAEDKTMLWIPEGFAHGFLAISEGAEVLYKTTDFYDPLSEQCLLWNDPNLAIPWPIEITPILSIKDSQGQLLVNSIIFE